MLVCRAILLVGTKKIAFGVVGVAIRDCYMGRTYAHAHMCCLT
jgi:hypothetical protein